MNLNLERKKKVGQPLSSYTHYKYTAGGLKSGRTGFTKMRATALIIVRLLQFFNTESLCI